MPSSSSIPAGGSCSSTRPSEHLLGPMRVGALPEEWAQLGRAYRPDTETAYALQELPLARALGGEQVIDEEVFIRQPGGRSRSLDERQREPDPRRGGPQGGGRHLPRHHRAEAGGGGAAPAARPGRRADRRGPGRRDRARPGGPHRPLQPLRGGALRLPGGRGAGPGLLRHAPARARPGPDPARSSGGRSTRPTPAARSTRSSPGTAGSGRSGGPIGSSRMPSRGSSACWPSGRTSPT